MNTEPLWSPARDSRSDYLINGRCREKCFDSYDWVYCDLPKGHHGEHFDEVAGITWLTEWEEMNASED